MVSGFLLVNFEDREDKVKQADCTKSFPESKYRTTRPEDRHYIVPKKLDDPYFNGGKQYECDQYTKASTNTLVIHNIQV